MSSTSSTEQNPRVRSATEVLASRYRHLFVLPSYPTLLVYGGVASFIISVLSRGLSGVVSSIPAFVVLILSATAISSALRILDPGTIATFRRAQALLLGADLLWLMIAAIGAAYALPFGSPNSLTNAILFGGFVCAGFEYLVIHGAFQKNAPLSFVLAVLHPTSTILVIRLSEVAKHFDPVAASAGVAALALMVAFPLLLRRRKTSLGHDALSLFQAFMKTWAAGNSDELEKIISDHAEDVEVTTKVLRFRTKARDAFVVLPGVHPGPFHPVGSYDLPGVVSRELKELGPVMTLHRPGGHERNLATRAETSRYVVEVGELARSTVPDDTKSFLRGPVHSKVDKATVSASAFDDDLVMTISFAPYGSDDIDTSVESELTGPASERGFELSVVDAHNSIDTNLESPVVADQGWKRIFEAMKKERADRFSVAYAHSSEVGFVGRGDLTENGVSLLLFQKQNEKSALVLADANNSVAGLRGLVEKALEASGYELVEFCTSDSHNLAARGLTTERGYQALGEATSPASIAELVVKLAKLSDSRLAPAQYGSASAKSRVRVFGAKALEEFAGLTQASSRFSLTYFKFAGVTAVLLLFASIFL